MKMQDKIAVVTGAVFQAIRHHKGPIGCRVGGNTQGLRLQRKTSFEATSAKVTTPSMASLRVVWPWSA